MDSKMHKINHANIKDWAKNYDGPLFDGILCDPPYHLVSMTKRWGSENVKNTPTMNTKEGGVFARSAKGFMGKDWDGVDENGIGIAQDPEMWRLLYNLLKPGAHLLAFSGSRTYHRMAVAIEDAGFEIRDQLIWMYGSGFPKSLNIGKAVDKINGTEAEQLPTLPMQKKGDVGEISKNRRCAICLKAIASGNPCQCDRTYKASNEYNGYGTALKPAHEPCVLARKPISEKNIAENVLKWGTGGINIDESRVEADLVKDDLARGRKTSEGVGIWGNAAQTKHLEASQLGRFPANLIHDGSDEVVGLFPDGAKQAGSPKKTTHKDGMFGIGTPGRIYKENNNSAARFFYCAKSSRAERNAGLEGFELKEPPASARTKPAEGRQNALGEPRQNHHPTVKPLSLTKYLANLIKPPTGGRLLVPFSGSGSEMIGALQAGWEYVEGVELTEEYIPIAEARIKHWTEQTDKQVKLI